VEVRSEHFRILGFLLEYSSYEAAAWSWRLPCSKTGDFLCIDR